MILIKTENSTLRESIVSKFECEAKKRMPCTASLPDFDDVDLKVKIEPSDLSSMEVQLHWNGWSTVRDLGGSELVRSVFPEHLQDDSGSAVTLRFSLDDDKAQAGVIADKIASLRADLLSAPLQAALTAVLATYSSTHPSLPHPVPSIPFLPFPFLPIPFLPIPFLPIPSYPSLPTHPFL
ncbi:MAG: hypothetical protein MHM6MM_009075, partial [Cercozoa sp. M6MM]